MLVDAVLNSEGKTKGRPDENAPGDAALQQKAKGKESTMELDLNEMSKVAGGYKRPPEKKGFFIYQIKRGDTLGKIARNFNTTVALIMAWNPKIKNKNLIYAGDYLYIQETAEG